MDGVPAEPAGGDVDIDTDHALRSAGCVVEDLASAVDPACATSSGADAVLHRPIVQLLLEELVKLRKDLIAILGVQAVNPQFVSGLLIERIIAQTLKAVGPIHIPVGDVPIPYASGDYLLGDAQSLFIGH